MIIKLKRTYDEKGAEDGYRILVDRLWPRGLRKSEANFDVWIKDAAPSTQLRKWFDHDPQKWDEFRQRYNAELAGSEGFSKLSALADRYPVLTLLSASRATEYTHSIVLKDALLAAKTAD